MVIAGSWPVLKWSLIVVSLAIVARLSETAHASPTSIAVAILHAPSWSAADSAREGAGEFEVLLQVAQLQRTHSLAGLVSVGNRHGVRPGGGEGALHHAALSGIPVVKLARGGEVAPSLHDLFIDAGPLTPHHARSTLEHCLAQFGAPPAALDPSNPSVREIAKIRAHLRQYRAAFREAIASRVAAR
jgi:hypothetical protein